MRQPAALFALCLAATTSLHAQTPPGHYLFAWTGDAAKSGNDFLAVIDANPASPNYAKLVTTLPTDQKTVRIHHTEYTMPASGMLFANDHDPGHTFIFDLRDPAHPKIAASFFDLAGFSHPHSFRRLPNGHVLASFQHVAPKPGGPPICTPGSPGERGSSGGIVEIDDQGHAIRAAGSADPAYPGALLMPYSLAVLPDIDRVLVTNSSMMDEDAHGHTYQIFRLSDLKLLHTEYFDTGGRQFGDIDPEEARVGPGGAVYVQTLACGIERVTGIAGDNPQSKLVYQFPGSDCGVPTIVGHYLLQSVPILHAVAVLDIANGANPIEVSRLKLDDTIFPHWTGWDAITGRVVVTGYDENRLFLLKLDQATGHLSIDTAFHDDKGQPGFDFANRAWPHGWQGSGQPHGVVFSR